MKQRLSISIVAYQNYAQIQQAISSIEKHTSSAVSKTIYISDNTISEDEKTLGEKADFKGFLAQYPDVEYVDNQANLGFGKGHNAVLNSIDSDYHAIVNPDIEIREDVFSSLLSYLDQETDVGMVIPRIVDENGKMQAAYREYPTVFDMFIRMFCKQCFLKRQARHTLSDRDYEKPFEVPFAQGCFLVLRTPLLKKVKGFDERYFMYMEDADLCKRISAQQRIMYYPYVSVTHKWEKGSHKNTKLMKIHVQSMFKYFQKWGWKLF